MLKSSKSNGFTIVELLIVIVVIGILASIMIVAYSGVQQRARNVQRTSEIASLQKAIEMYRLDEGAYPMVGADNSGQPLTSLAPFLVPKYIARLPVEPKSGNTAYQYVRGPAANESYGIRVSFEPVNTASCHKGVNNTGLSWWSLLAC